MKKLFVALFGIIVLTSCSGDEGPMGPAGPPGPQGPYIVGTVFEIEGVNLTAVNNYSFVGFYADYVPADIEILRSDVVLIYLLEDIVDGKDIWSLLPQTFFLQGGGIVQYNFNHTDVDFEIYLHGNINLGTLGPGFTQNQIFRIAILPAEFANSMKMDFTDYDSVISAMRTKNPDFEVIQVEK